MGVTIGKVKIKDRPSMVRSVGTFLTDINGNFLHIIEGVNDIRETIEIIPSNNIEEFFIGEEFFDIGEYDEFYNTSYDLMLIVLEKMLLDDIKQTHIFYKDDLMKEYYQYNQDIKEAKKNINIA